MSLATFNRPDSGGPSGDKAALRRLQSDMVILESDRSKLTRETDALELELRDIKRKWTLLGMDIQTKETLFKKKRQNLDAVTESIRQLKKRINLL